MRLVTQMFSLLHFPSFNSPRGPLTTPTPRSLETPHPLWPQEVVFLRTCRQTRMWSPRFHPTWNQIWQHFRPFQVSTAAVLKQVVAFILVLFYFIWCIVWLGLKVNPPVFLFSSPSYPQWGAAADVPSQGWSGTGAVPLGAQPGCQ